MNGLLGQTVLITGAARRVGHALALAAARAGADILLHHGHSPQAAQTTAEEIRALGRWVWILQQDLSLSDSADLIEKAWHLTPFTALVNNAAIFEDETWDDTTRESWQRHLEINLTAPFFLAQAFARRLDGHPGVIVNILDWRALRPGADHLPYTVSKAALAALTRSLASALAPNIRVNGIALGAILPPSDGGASDAILDKVPAKRWATMDEVGNALVYLLQAEYTTGSIIHVDGGRHLV
jgi:NAD(P)-dependent dehydrogenase (short-subunit alcohol dehydrogenase family)